MKINILIAILFMPFLAMAQSDFQRHYQKGTDYYSRGIYYKAINSFKNAEKAATKNYEINRACKGLADSYKAISDNIHALACYEKLLPLYKGENLNVVLINMSDLWNQTGQYAKTIEKLEPMKTKYEEVKLNNLSVAYLRTAQEQKAIDFFDKIIDSKDSLTLAVAMQNKGYALWNIGNNSEAALWLDSALAKYTDNSKSKYICLGNLAKVNSALGKHDKALEQIDMAIKWQQKKLGTSNADYIISLRKKAEILLAKGDSIAATMQFKQFFELERDYIAQNFAYMSENERINYWHTQKALLDECFATENINPDFLFDVAVFSKSVLIQAHRNFAQSVSQNSKLSTLYDSLLTIRNMIRSADSIGRKKLGFIAESLEKQLVDNLPNLKSYTNDLKISGNDIRRNLKNDNDIVVEFVCYSKNGQMRYAALVMRRSEPIKFVPLFSSSEIEGFKINRLYNVQECIDKQGGDLYAMKGYKKVLYNDTALSKFVWDKILADIPKSSNVYFVPDGIFYSFAVEYLPTVRDSYQLFRLSSSRVLCHRTPAKRLDNFLLVGALKYNDTTSVRTYQDTVPNRLGSKLYGKLDPFLDFKNSEAEVDYISNILGISKSSVITGDKGTEDFIKQNLCKYQAALLSTHGYFCKKGESLKVDDKYSLSDIITEDQSMSLCGLVFAGVNIMAQNDSSHINKEDGLFTALEISELDLSRLDLLVLSACQTNIGRITRDGIFNLPRGLKKAGANTLLVSLWQVDNIATQKLITAFLTNLKQGMSKYEALLNAQSQLKSSEEYNQPYYWAAFVLIDGI